VASGANGTLSPADLDKAKAEIETAGWLLMQLEIPIETVLHAARTAHENGVGVILNPAPARTLPEELFQYLDMIVPNEKEAEMLSGVQVGGWESARTAAGILGAKGVNIVVITLGSLGALIKEGDRYYEIEATPVKAVDTTAAGDTFCGALCVGLSEGKSLADSVRFACKAAAISVTRMGAQSSVPYRKELSQQESF